MPEEKVNKDNLWVYYLHLDWYWFYLVFKRSSNENRWSFIMIMGGVNQLSRYTNVFTSSSTRFSIIFRSLLRRRPEQTRCWLRIRGEQVSSSLTIEISCQKWRYSNCWWSALNIKLHTTKITPRKRAFRVRKIDGRCARMVEKRCGTGCENRN